ncbi:MAG: hypothetical protein N2V78_09040 [Methanophagales archaeon]|nr:hypothetical protein [Methanophagales archaeon]
MATLFEYYNTGDDNSWYIFGSNWLAQTFTPQTTHKITSVKLKLLKFGSGGTISVDIKATDEYGHPTGDALCSGTTDGSTLPGSPGEWREVTLGDGATLSSGTKYAIVIHTTVEFADRMYWREDATTPTYGGGAEERSDNSGGSWTTEGSCDLMFEEWGEYPSKDLSNQLVIRKVGTKNFSQTLKLRKYSQGDLLNQLVVKRSGYNVFSQTLTISGYLSEGTLTSVQLIPPYSKDIFAFESNVTLNGGTVKVQFSDDNVNFYNHVGTPNTWDALDEGYNLIYVSKANLTDKFYYKLKLTKSADNNTPYVNWIKVTYLVPYSTYVFFSQLLGIRAANHSDLGALLLSRLQGYSIFSQKLKSRWSDYDILQGQLIMRGTLSNNLLQKLGVNHVWNDFLQTLTIPLHEDYLALANLLNVRVAGYDLLLNELLLRKSDVLSLSGQLLTRKENLLDLIQIFIVKGTGSEDFLNELLLRRSYLRELYGLLTLRRSDTSSLSQEIWVRPFIDLGNELIVARRGTLIIPHILTLRRSWWRELNGALLIPIYDDFDDLETQLLLRKKQVSFPKCILEIRKEIGSSVNQKLEVNKYNYTGLNGSAIVRKIDHTDLSSIVDVGYFSLMFGKLKIRRTDVKDISNELDIRTFGTSEISETLDIRLGSYKLLPVTLELSKSRVANLTSFLYVGRMEKDLLGELLIRKVDYETVPAELSLRRSNTIDFLNELLLKKENYKKVYQQLLLRKEGESSLSQSISIFGKSFLDGKLVVEKGLRLIVIDVEKASVYVQLMKGKET